MSRTVDLPNRRGRETQMNLWLEFKKEQSFLRTKDLSTKICELRAIFKFSFPGFTKIPMITLHQTAVLYSIFRNCERNESKSGFPSVTKVDEGNLPRRKKSDVRSSSFNNRLKQVLYLT